MNFYNEIISIFTTNKSIMSNNANGGRKRTILSGCGWSCKKTPRECEYLFKLHRKRCDECRGTGDLPEFDRNNARANGWNGVNSKYQVQREFTTAYRTTTDDGVRLEGAIASAQTRMPTMEELLPFIEALPRIDVVGPAPRQEPKKNPKKKKSKK